MSEEDRPVTRAEYNSLVARVAALEHAQKNILAEGAPGIEMPAVEGDGSGEALPPYDPVAQGFKEYRERARAHEDQRRKPA